PTRQTPAARPRTPPRRRHRRDGRHPTRADGRGVRDRRRDVRRVGARPVTGLRGAVAFLTRVPVGRAAAGVDLARSAPYVPVVGALVGLAVAGADIGVGAVLPGLPAAGVAVTVGVVLTGALHEDGLADTA